MPADEPPDVEFGRGRGSDDEERDRSPVYQRYRETREIDAIRRAIRAAGWDLSKDDGDDERALTEFLKEGRRRQDRRQHWAKSRAGTIAWGAALVGGAAFSSAWPEVLGWLKLHIFP